MVAFEWDGDYDWHQQSELHHVYERPPNPHESELAMPCLSDPEHEAAAQHLARKRQLDEKRRAELKLTGDPTLQQEAAAIGGLDPQAKSFKSNARRFCNGRTIASRVVEIQRVGAALASVTVGTLLVEAEDARDLAMRLKEPSAANACIQTKAKLAGLWREKVDQHTTGQYECIERIIVECVPRPDDLSGTTR